MATTAQGYVTVSDITDGLPTIAVIQTNENHTFPANDLGTVLSADRTAFSNEIIVLSGTDQLTYVTTLPTTGQFRVTVDTINGTAPGSFTDLTTTLTATASKPKIDASGNTVNVVLAASVISTSVTVKSFIVKLKVEVFRLGEVVTLYTNTTLSKALGGTAHSITVSSSRQNFVFQDAFATAPLPTSGSLNSDIFMNAIYNGPDITNITWQKNINGDGTTFVALTGATTSPTSSSKTITTADFPASQQFMTIKVSKAGVEDKISIFRTDRGQANFYIVPEVTAGSLTLKNNSGSVSIVARVYKGGVEVTPLTGWSFVWKNGSTDISTSPPSGVTVANNDSGTKAKITINASYIADGTSITLNVTGTGP
jgi:hypothetical protein